MHNSLLSLYATYQQALDAGSVPCLTCLVLHADHTLLLQSEALPIFTSLTLKCPTALFLDSLTLDNYFLGGFLYFLIIITKYLRETT